MLTDLNSFLINDWTSLAAQSITEPARIIPGWNKADVMTIGLISNIEPSHFCFLAYVDFSCVTQWKNRTLNLIDGKNRENVGLVFGLINATMKRLTRWTLLSDRIVTRDYSVEIHRSCAI